MIVACQKPGPWDRLLGVRSFWFLVAVGCSTNEVQFRAVEVRKESPSHTLGLQVLPHP